MHPAPPDGLKPRKTPRQARAEATLDAIFEATIQVLLAVGERRLTTTRVAERAGVSVGTMYQYFPHKQALLYAVLQWHLAHISAAVEVACQGCRGRPAAEMAHRSSLFRSCAASCHSCADLICSHLDEPGRATKMVGK